MGAGAGRVYAQAFGNVLKRRRARLGLSQEGLAEAADCHRTHVGFLERAEKVATLAVARRIAIALGITLPRLVTEVEREFARLGGDGGSARK